MSVEEWKALKSLQTDNPIKVILADKENKTLVLDRDLYISKLEERPSQHKPIPSYSAIKHEKVLD